MIWVYELEDGYWLIVYGGIVVWWNNNLGNLKFEFKGSVDLSVYFY